MINEGFHLLPTMATKWKILKFISLSSSEGLGGSRKQMPTVVVDSLSHAMHTVFGCPSSPALQPCVSLATPNLSPPWIFALKTLVQVLHSESRSRQEFGLGFTWLRSNKSFVVSVGLAHLSRQTDGTLFYFIWFIYSVTVPLHDSSKDIIILIIFFDP